MKPEYPLELTFEDQVELKRWLASRRNEGSGCLSIFSLFALILGIFYLITLGFLYSMPLSRVDASGQRYLCWHTKHEHIWQSKEDRELACMPEHHRVVPEAKR